MGHCVASLAEPRNHASSEAEKCGTRAEPELVKFRSSAPSFLRNTRTFAEVRKARLPQAKLMLLGKEKAFTWRQGNGRGNGRQSRRGFHFAG
jgi:hypothetical protein